MTGSSADPRRRLRAAALGALAAGLLTAAAPAAGQVLLQPAPGGPAADPFTAPAPFDPVADEPRGPIRLFPLPGEGGEDAAPPPARPREVREGILAFDSLEAVSPEAAGLLDADQAGLPVDLWQGSERAVLVHALRALPVAAPSRARHDLLRRVLLVAAPPPAADGAPAEDAADASTNLLALRLDRLLRAGATADVRALVGAVGPDARSGAEAEPLRRAEVESLFIDARLEDACAIVVDGLGRFDGVFWQKASAFCDLVQGRPQQAGLQLSMLREQGIQDPAFLWAAEQLSGLRVLSLGAVTAPTPLTIAMMRATGRPYPAGTLVDPEPWLSRAVALGEKTDLDTRLQTAEEAFLAGAVSRDELTALYGQVSFPADAFAKPLAEVVSERGATAHALLWQMANRQTVPAAKAEVIAAGLEAARTRQQPLLGAYLYAPLIETLSPAPEFMWFAGPAARALYATGRFDAARAWFRLVVEAAPTDSTAARAADLLWPLDRIAFETPSDRWPARRLEAWREAVVAVAREDGGEPAERRLPRLEARLLSLFQATGDQVRAADWAPLFGALSGLDGAVPPSPAWHAVTEATDSLRVGESLLLSLMILGETTPGTASDAALFRAVESLRLLGLEAAARRIAVESAVAAGL